MPRPATIRRSASPCNTSLTLLACLALAAGPDATLLGEEPGEADPKGLSNPVAYTPSSIALGRKHYLRHCQSCHGFDGRALENIDFEAADLTDPSRWRFGTSDGEIFVNTREGVAEEMPPFRSQLDDEEIWHLVNYLRSLGPADLRPPLVEEGGEGEGKDREG